MRSELAQLMEEPPGGPNHGRRARSGLQSQDTSVRADFAGRQDGRVWEPLGVDEAQAAEFMREGGWTIVHSKDGARAGVSSHGVNQYTVVHPDEYVDADVLRVMVERELGFSYEQVRSVYRQGRTSASQRELRARIDARLLALSRAGANMAELGRALGFPIKDDGHCRVMENALTRARAAEEG